MIKTLVAIPYKKNLHPHFYQSMLKLSEMLIEFNPNFDIEFARYTNDGMKESNDGICSSRARARNELLNKYLCLSHEFILWIDADIVDYPADLLTSLYTANPGGITAPVVLIENSYQFYDTYGFIENGKNISHTPPYFQSTKKLVSLDCVGCVYLIPAGIYHAGAQYADTPGRTEHENVMKVAREQNMRIVCDRETIVYHADLPRYGLNWHGH